ncbi:unnamed protein product, partial [Staurois parvus]
MRHCKTESYKHDSQRQRHDGTCSSPTAGGPQLPTSALSIYSPCKPKCSPNQNS